MKERLFKFLFPAKAKELDRITQEHEINTKLLDNAEADLRELVTNPNSLKSSRIKMRVQFTSDMEKAFWEADSNYEDKGFGLFGGFGVPVQQNVKLINDCGA